MPDIHSHGMGRVKRVHFIGIGGAGMGGIAEVLKNLGYTVSGSDVKENRVTRRLKSLDIDVHIGHSPEYVEKSDVVVVTSAIKPDNIELDAARSLRIPVVRRAEMLAELMRFNQGIAIAGTHGKTTTTSLVASVLAEAGLDPTYVIGGLLNSSGTNARLGSGKYFVAEADESDASFLHLHPVVSVITNIDADHLDTYGGDMANLRNHFVEFLRQLPFYGLAILCLDDEGVRKILPEVTRPVVTYGLDFEADYNAELIRQEGNKTWFKVSHQHERDWLEVELNLPGRHNLRNALAAIAVAHELGVEDKSIVNALRHFQGIARRCHVRGQVTIGENTATLIDDYAHHPTEIAACFDAIHGGWEGRRLVVVYQPHRYTRMRDLFEDFCQVLSRADVLLVLDVYPAGEEPITSADSRSLCRAIRLRGQIEPISVQDPTTLQNVLSGVLKEDDLLLTLGAGDIGAMSRKLYEDCATTVH